MEYKICKICSLATDDKGWRVILMCNNIKIKELFICQNCATKIIEFSDFDRTGPT